jgi:hypothetical protein
MRHVLGLCVIVLMLVASSAFAYGAPTSPPERRHPSGIALLPPLDTTPFVRARERLGPAFEPLAVAWSDARELALANRDVFGAPWLNAEKGELVIALAKPEGEAIARSWMKSGAPRANTTKPAETLRPTQVPVRFRAVRYSFGQLESVMHDAIGRGALGFDGESRIWSSQIDDETQRVVLETDRVVDGFLVTLARTYGTEIVAVRVDPHAGPFTTLTGGPTDTADPGRQLTIVGGIAALSTLLVALGIALLRRRRSHWTA